MGDLKLWDAGLAGAEGKTITAARGCRHNLASSKIGKRPL
jgi:hypothetical protein